MSTYLQRISALTAVLVFALAVAFGLAGAQQAYADKGGDSLATTALPISTQSYTYGDVVAAPLADSDGNSVLPADYKITSQVYWTSSTKAKVHNADGTAKNLETIISATGLQKLTNASGNSVYRIGFGIAYAEGDTYAFGMGAYPSTALEFSAGNTDGSIEQDGKTYNLFYFESETPLAGSNAYVGVKHASGDITVYDVNLQDVYAEGELTRGLYEVEGLEIDTGMINLDPNDAKTYIKVDDGQAKLLVRVYNANKYDYIFLGKVEDRPDPADTSKMIAGVPVAADKTYVESGAKKSQIFTDAEGILGAKGSKYKAMYFELPITQADIAAQKVFISIRRASWGPSNQGQFMGEVDHFFTFTGLTPVEAASDFIDCNISDADTIAAVEAANTIPFEPTVDDVSTYAEAYAAYGELDYSSADVARAFLDMMIPEVKVKLDAADESIPNIVPADGTYVFTQTLKSFNYPSVAEGLYSDSLYSAVLTVEGGKMTVQIAQRRGTYHWAYLGMPTDAAAAYAAAGKDVTKMENVYGFQNETEVYLDHAAGTTGPDGDHVADTPGVYQMYTATIPLKSLEKPVAMAFITKANGSGTWYNRSFTFHAANMYTTKTVEAIRAIDALLNSPDQEDPDTIYPVYKIDPTLLTDGNLEAIEAAYSKFNGLTADEQAAIKDLAIISTPDEATDGQTYGSALSLAMSKVVAHAMNVIPGTVGTSDESAIAAVRALYDSLTDEAKGFVPAESLAKLTKAEKQISDAKKAAEEAAAEAAKKKVTKVTVNVKNVTAAAITKAVKKAGGDAKYVKTIVLGKKVAKIAKNSFKGFAKVTTVQIKSTKIKKASAVKNCFKGSKVKTVKVPKAKLKAYKKIFTKKITGAKKLTVKK